MTSLFASLFRRSEKRRAYSDLLKFDDRMLRDIGVSRSDLHQMMGGARINREEVIDLRGRYEALASLLREGIEKIQSFGCQVKDLDIGLIDFPTMYKGEEVLLCWKLGERGITWWHGLEEGFGGRKPIDGEFIAGHRGDKTN